MKRILANDGIDEAGKQKLTEAGFEVLTEKVAQENLADFINRENIPILTVRSATKVTAAVMEACKNLKLVVRAGVGTDNIDSEAAKKFGVAVMNTPAASSDSVAELVIAGMFAMCRQLYDSNREMPLRGSTAFNALKKKYSEGSELRGKTLGIIGFGRIGQAVASRALGLGMEVLASDPFVKNANVSLPISGLGVLNVPVSTVEMHALLPKCDYITLHVPGGTVLGKDELAQLKKGVCLINTSRGGVIDEQALIEALNSGQVAHAFLDVFTNEPTPDEKLLTHPRIALSPHIGAATNEAQYRIGVELAEKIIAFAGN
jgi:D-3-phosphoglycerate dehydrogenase